MDATIHITGKKIVKVVGAACLATGVVAENSAEVIVNQNN